MSLIAVYDAFRSVGVGEAKAAAAVEGIEAFFEAPRLQRIDGRITALQADITGIQVDMTELQADIKLLIWICSFNLVLNIATLAIVIRLAFGG